MDLFISLLQLAIGLSILNVWLLRKNKATPWRAGNAQNMEEEFAAYGLTNTLMKIVGTIKLALALVLIMGIWIPSITPYAAGGLALTLLAAVVAHIKVHDPLQKSIPAATLMTLSTAILVL